MIWVLARSEWRRMLFASFWAFLTVAASVGLMMSSGYILTYAALQPSIAVLQLAIVAVRFFGLARGIFRWMDRMQAHETALHLLEKYRLWFYQRLEPLVPVALRQVAKGDLFQALARDVDSLEFLYVRVISPPLVALWTSLLMLYLLGRNGLLYWGVFASAQVLAIGLSLSLLPKMAKASLKARQKAAEVQAVYLDLLQSMDILRIQGRLPQWQKEVLRLEGEFNSATRKAQSLTAFGEAWVPVIGMASVVGIAWMGGQAVFAQNLGGIPWVTLILGAWAAFESVLAFPALAQALQASLAAADRLEGIAGLKAARAKLVGEVPEKLISANTLSCQNLSFQWPDGGIIFRDFNLELAPGKSCALLGPSGVGKSTLVQILARFIDATSGKILLQGVDLQKYPDDYLHQKIAILDQSPQIFTGSLRDNLTLACEGLPEESLCQALQEVGLWDWAVEKNQENPLDAWVGEQGQHLSGGQRQRLAAAQVLLRKADLLVLDEPAAHLDPASEAELLQMFLRHIRANPHKAMLVITHRPQFLDLFDSRCQMTTQ